MPREPETVRIVKYPHPTLRHPSKPLRRVDAELKKFVAEMFELMYEHRGIGLAANQVDLPYQFFIVNVTGDKAAKEEEHVLINPMIVKRDGNIEADEGCLSLPDIFAPVRRSERIVATAYTLTGEEKQYDVDGMLARVIQHEYDHLEGKLFIDRISPANMLNVKESLAEMELEFDGDRRRGVIPDDRQIVARLSKLEALRA